MMASSVAVPSFCGATTSFVMPTSESDYLQQPCNVIIVGASGDLTRRKLMPALFSLFCNDMLPEQLNIVGFARSSLSNEMFRERISTHLVCRYEEEAERCQERIAAFLNRCTYCSGNYDSLDGFTALQDHLGTLSTGPANTLLYMAVPPSLFVPIAQTFAATSLIDPGPDRWLHVVLEKPFGRDSTSSSELMTALATCFAEEQTYRIDHYLGKEVIQNLMILRFANLIFEPVWNRDHIEHVSISWSEQIGCGGRAGYFDNYGIIRDVLQNHLLQIVALVGMEQPIYQDAEHICDEKVKMLRAVPPIKLADTVVGQYSGVTVDDSVIPGYLDDNDVPSDSLTPTYVRTVLYCNNPRWHGVPFRLEAGKAVNTQRTEIVIQFKDVPYSIFSMVPGMTANRLVIRVQPDEAISLHVVNRLPGLGQELASAKLNLHYQSAFQQIVPDAYERLLLDVLRGDRSLFIRDDELAAAWDIVTPLLEGLETRGIKPQPYAYGSDGPTRM